MASPPFRFTMFDLNSCLLLPAAIHNNGGRLTTVELAQHLGYKSENNGSFNTRLGNARLFGLIEGTQAGLTASKRAISILHPDFPETEMRARLEAFEAVPLFKAVLDQYHGQPLPDEKGMLNALSTRWSVTAEKAPIVLARMMDSAEEAGLFKVAGNRSKMIRPTIAGGTPAGPPAPPAGANGASGASGGAGGSGGGSGGTELRSTKVRDNKMIDGVLDELPEGNWSEAELQQWMRFFESALRVVYKLPAEAG